MSGLGDRALGVTVGLLLDRALGEPPAPWHPVAWFGTVMGRVEQLGYRDSRAAGTAYAATGVAIGAGAGLALQALGRRLLGRGAPAAVVTVGTAVAVASAGRLLRHTSSDIEESLRAGDLAAARERLPWLVGRDPSALDASGVSAAVVESLAENTVDAVVAPVLWALVAGAPGVLAHRAVNTMDAMVGHRSRRYARFGTAAARADDVLAWVPARVFAALVAVHAGPAGGTRAGGTWAGGTRAGGTRAGWAQAARSVVRTVCRDAPAHPSPNSGVAESAVAAALGVQVGGPLRYGGRVELRSTLGDGPRPGPGDIAAARRLVDRVELTLLGAALAGWALTRRTVR